MIAGSDCDLGPYVAVSLHFTKSCHSLPIPVTMIINLMQNFAKGAMALRRQILTDLDNFGKIANMLSHEILSYL